MIRPPEGYSLLTVYIFGYGRLSHPGILYIIHPAEEYQLTHSPINIQGKTDVSPIESLRDVSILRHFPTKTMIVGERTSFYT